MQYQIKQADGTTAIVTVERPDLPMPNSLQARIAANNSMSDGHLNAKKPPRQVEEEVRAAFKATGSDT